MHQMLVEIAQGVHVDPEIVWAPTSFLKANKVSAWRDMPVWIPGQNETFGFHRRDISRAIAEGLTYRPLPLTAADALAWFRTLPSERQKAPRRPHPRARIRAAREAESPIAGTAAQKPPEARNPEAEHGATNVHRGVVVKQPTW
jgi:hypothetical protein